MVRQPRECLEVLQESEQIMNCSGEGIDSEQGRVKNMTMCEILEVQLLFLCIMTQRCLESPCTTLEMCLELPKET